MSFVHRWNEREGRPIEERLRMADDNFVGVKRAVVESRQGYVGKEPEV